MCLLWSSFEHGMTPFCYRLLDSLATEEFRGDQNLFRGKGAGLEDSHTDTPGLRSALGTELGDLNSIIKLFNPVSKVALVVPGPSCKKESQVQTPGNKRTQEPGRMHRNCEKESEQTTSHACCIYAHGSLEMTK